MIKRVINHKLKLIKVNILGFYQDHIKHHLESISSNNITNIIILNIAILSRLLYRINLFNLLAQILMIISVSVYYIMKCEMWVITTSNLR